MAEPRELAVPWLAEAFHEAYERLAPSFGYQTRPDSAVPWEQVPEPNRSLMLATIAAILDQPGVEVQVRWTGGIAITLPVEASDAS